MEKVTSFKFLGTSISEDITRSINTTALNKKAQQRLFFHTTLRKTCLLQQMLITFYGCSVESILTYCISVWFSSCTVSEKNALQKVVLRAQKKIGVELPKLEDIYKSHCFAKAIIICKDSTHPCHFMFELLPSGRRYTTSYARTSRMRKFYSKAMDAMNQAGKILI